MEVDEARAYISIGETRVEHCAQVTSIFLIRVKSPILGAFSLIQNISNTSPHLAIQHVC